MSARYMKARIKCLPLALMLIGCGQTSTDSKVSYATFTPGRETMRAWSAFTTIEQRSCILPVQLYATAGAYVSPEQAAFVRQSTARAVIAWTGALEQNPYWPCKNRVRVSWGEAGSGTVQIYLEQSVSRAYSLVGQNKIFLSLASAVPSDAFAERVILHEFGHMFGLADTYSEAGYQTPIGQAPGIMNQLYQVGGLTSDDINGANALYEYINGRREFCSSPYTVGGAWENPRRIAFCV